MELSDFYGALLPPTGYYTLFDPKGNGGMGAHIWAGTIAELVAKTEERNDQPNIYFATGAYQRGSRKQESCTGKKCFYLDIDAGAAKYAKNPKTAWPTLRDALAALVAFIREFGLRPTLVISSGGGLHVYWVLDEVLSGVEWTAIALRWHQSLKSNPVKTDPTCTADSARILRPLGALHSNGNRVTLLSQGPTCTVEQFRAAVMAMPVPVEDDFPIAAKGIYGLDASAINDDLAPTYVSVPTSGVKVAQNCPAMAECRDERGNVTEPQWRGMLGVLKHCVDGPELAHEWSKGHPEYDRRATQNKFDRYAAGPTTCENFSAYTDKCVGCEHRGKIKSPVVLGRITVEEKAADPELAEIVEAATAAALASAPAPRPVAGIPEGVFGPAGAYRYELRGNRMTLRGSKTVQIDNPNGEGKIEQTVWVDFSNEAFWLSGWTEAGGKQVDASTLTLQLFRSGRIHQFEFPNEFTADRKAILKFLSSRAINTVNYEPSTTAMLHQYIADQLKRVKESAARPVVREHLGFHMEEDGSLTAAYGELVIKPDGSIIKAVLDPRLAAVRDSIILESLPPNPNSLTYPPTVWGAVGAAGRQQADFYAKWFGMPGMEVAQLAIMMQMASPLLVFAAEEEMLPGGQLPSIGITVSLYSSASGKGKTSIQSASAYAFGNAANMVRQGDRNGISLVAQVSTAAALGTFPFPLDEVTQNDKKDAAISIQRMSQGQEKSRGQQDGSVKHAPFRWALITTVSTNIPQRDLLSEQQQGSDALQMRLIELNCDVLPTRTSDAVPEYEQALRTAMTGTKGSIGAMLHMYCCRVGYRRMREMLDAKKAEIVQICPGEIKERFAMRGFAAMLALQDILTSLGLSFFNRQTLLTEMIKTFTDIREQSITKTHESGSNFLRMISELSPAIMITNQEITESSMVHMENERYFRGPAAGRLCRGSNVLYLSVEAVRRWAVDNGLSPATIMSQANSSGFLLDSGAVTQVILSTGVHGQWLPRMRIIKVNASAMRVTEAPVPANVKQLVHKDASHDGDRMGREAVSG